MTHKSFVLAIMLWAGLAASAQADQMSGPFVSPAVEAISSPEVRSLPPEASAAITKKIIRPRQNPLAQEPGHGARGTWNRGPAPLDPLIGARSITRGVSPPPLLGFDGGGNPSACGGCSPPDPNGDVGPNHYVQVVNATLVSIYDKAGTLLTPRFQLNTLWPVSGTTTCDDSFAGDPVVVYDGMANRWLLSQFSTGNGICVAVSQTGDPAGAYWLYEFPTGTDFPDYFKFGVWPDGYYMSANETTYTAYAFDRAKMLNGQPATFQKFTGETNFLLPSDLDGRRRPPSGAPNHFYTFKDSVFHGGTADRLEVFAFHVDWATPANSTFTLEKTLNIAPFTYTVCGFFNLNCVRQKGTTMKVDTVSEWPMFRFPYRNFDSYQALAGVFTVGGASGETGAAPRWFELRNTGSGWTLFQQGTIDPGDGKDRFMASIAMDRVGNLAIGYSVFGSTMYPAIRYTVHRIGDALGTTLPEAAVMNGAGSQTGSNRWGDYSAMSIDPADDFSFWYTNEYYSVSSASNWKTRIGKFRIIKLASFRSIAANDGDVLESTETSTVGGSIDAGSTSFRLGDNSVNSQFRGILDFDTSTLPDTAVITSLVLKITQQGTVTGADPFSTLGDIAADIKKGGFSGNLVLQRTDFEASPSLGSAGVILKPASGTVYLSRLKKTAIPFVDKTGHTQIRLRFQTDDNNNASADFLRFASGNHATVAVRPQLVVRYYVP